MTGHEILKELKPAGSDERCFIKWWRKENDFVDYGLVETFLENLDPDHEFSGFELLTAKRMWEELQRRVPRRVTLGHRFGQTVIHWQHRGKDGTTREDVFPFEPQALMTIFDEETRGDTMA